MLKTVPSQERIIWPKMSRVLLLRNCYTVIIEDTGQRFEILFGKILLICSRWTPNFNLFTSSTFLRFELWNSIVVLQTKYILWIKRSLEMWWIEDWNKSLLLPISKIFQRGLLFKDLKFIFLFLTRLFPRGCALGVSWETGQIRASDEAAEPLRAVGSGWELPPEAST